MGSPATLPRILIVEDEAVIALHLADILAELGYEVVASLCNPDDVIAVLQKTRPDLVLMDIRLGKGQDGITLAEEIYTCEGTPVVFVSAFADIATLERARVSGAFGFVTKPISTLQLNAAILIALEKSEEMTKAIPANHE